MKWTIVFRDGSAVRVNADKRSFDRQLRGRKWPPVEAIYMPLSADPALERYLREEILAPACADSLP